LPDADESVRRARKELLDLLTGLYHSNFERSHRTIERATSQGTKILATAHAGLGVILAAWLQRIFEGAPAGHLVGLAGYLVAALFPVMLGLPTVGIVCFLDVRCAQYLTQSTTKQFERVLIVVRGTNPPNAGEQSQIEALTTQGQALDQRALRWNSWSEGVGLAGWGLLAVSFAIVATGVLRALCY
jgi:hypothetical protein